MARRPRENDDDVSLFPFLSIIACVIGVLTMMISTLALAQMGTDEDVALIEAHEKATRDLSAAEEDVAGLRDILNEKLGPDAVKIRDNLAGHEKELKELAAELERARRIVELFESNPGAGTLGMDGEMIDRPHFVQAKRILQLARRLAAL